MENFKVKAYQIFSRKISPGQRIRLAFLSDLHGLCYGEGNCRLVRAVENARPDAVLAGGDMMVSKLPLQLEAAGALFSSLVKRFPVYYAFGNHERRLMEKPEKYGYEFQEFCGWLGGQGVCILRNERAWIDQKSGIPLSVWGWDGDLRFYRKLRPAPVKPDDLIQALGQTEDGAYHILLAHNPQFAQAYFSWGADLILCGHYHGGVWRFSENRGLASPNLRLFPAYCCGMFEKREQCMVVSPGLGEHTLKFRIRNPRELIVLEIVHGGGK